jgi:hypothetical protein
MYVYDADKFTPHTPHETRNTNHEYTYVHTYTYIYTYTLRPCGYCGKCRSPGFGLTAHRGGGEGRFPIAPPTTAAAKSGISTGKFEVRRFLLDIGYGDIDTRMRYVGAGPRCVCARCLRTGPLALATCNLEWHTLEC